MVLVLIGAWGPEAWYQWNKHKLTNQWQVGNFITVDSVYVADSVEGEPVYLVVEREIFQEFRGTYTVEIRTLVGSTVICTASDTVNYRPDAELPDPLTLAWWANDGDCSGRDLPPGDYVLETTWTVHNDVAKVEDQTLITKSNPFHVASEQQTRGLERQLQIQQQQIERLEQQIESK